jgi:hypothetical protein
MLGQRGVLYFEEGGLLVDNVNVCFFTPSAINYYSPVGVLKLDHCLVICAKRHDVFSKSAVCLRGYVIHAVLC